MARRPTKNQIEYARQINLLSRRIRNLEKQGYIAGEIIPVTPQRITKKSIDYIKSLRGKNLQSKFDYLDIDTGELINAVERKKELRKQRREQKQKSISKQELETYRLNQFRNKLESMEDFGLKGISKFYDEKLEEIGKERMSEILRELEERGIVFQPDDLYASEKIKHALNFITMFEDMMRVIPEFRDTEMKFEMEEDAEEWEIVEEAADFWGGL